MVQQFLWYYIWMHINNFAVSPTIHASVLLYQEKLCEWCTWKWNISIPRKFNLHHNIFPEGLKEEQVLIYIRLLSDLAQFAQVSVCFVSLICKGRIFFLYVCMPVCVCVCVCVCVSSVVIYMRICMDVLFSVCMSTLWNYDWSWMNKRSTMLCFWTEHFSNSSNKKEQGPYEWTADISLNHVYLLSTI